MGENNAHPSLPEFDRFIEFVRARCEKGAREYGSGSFDKPLPQGLQEIMEELADQAGWAWCQWLRLYRIQQQALREDPICLVCSTVTRSRTEACGSECDGWTCTRTPGHGGDHVACSEKAHRIAAWATGATQVTLTLPEFCPHA